jgi:hypothetical protein
VAMSLAERPVRSAHRSDVRWPTSEAILAPNRFRRLPGWDEVDAFQAQVS